MLKKVKKIKLIAFSLLTLITLTACFYPIHRPENANEQFNSGDLAWMLISSAMVMIMTPGLSFFYGGMVNKKNVVSTMLQSFMALGIVSLLWYTVGFSLAFGDSIGGLIGDPRTYFMMNNVGTASHPKLSPTIPVIIAGVIIPNEICNYYPRNYHWFVCRKSSFLELHNFYVFIQFINLLSNSTLVMASKWILTSMGSD